LRERKYENGKKTLHGFKKGVGTHGEMIGNNWCFVPLPCYKGTKGKTVLSTCTKAIWFPLQQKLAEDILFCRHAHPLTLGALRYTWFSIY